ncbi:unnamed protein product [Prorocentrum cordatum]|uniref:Uncharacterized protein n=1 Tax=Prorocentrum cordatum TaxID=2364126 RepID=A0ABN9R524_9DINO|nr:unnamed protein product [Polarella glacialis]
MVRRTGRRQREVRKARRGVIRVSGIESVEVDGGAARSAPAFAFKQKQELDIMFQKQLRDIHQLLSSGDASRTEEGADRNARDGSTGNEWHDGPNTDPWIRRSGGSAEDRWESQAYNKDKQF